MATLHILLLWLRGGGGGSWCELIKVCPFEMVKGNSIFSSIDVYTKVFLFALDHWVWSIIGWLKWFPHCIMTNEHMCNQRDACQRMRVWLACGGLMGGVVERMSWVWKHRLLGQKRVIWTCEKRTWYLQGCAIHQFSCGKVYVILECCAGFPA